MPGRSGRQPVLRQGGRQGRSGDPPGHRPDRSVAIPPDFRLERSLWTQGCAWVAGVDEAGRGALAGPVVVAAVVLPEIDDLPYVDSKTVSEPRREHLAQHVKRTALAWALGEATVAEVDALGPLQATHVAAHRALADLPRRPEGLVTDYLKLRFAEQDEAPLLLSPARADRLSLSVAAASLLAKTHRDARMRSAAVHWPVYGFDRHKGYGVAAHLRALREVGPCPVHRLSYAPVAAAVQNGNGDGHEPAPRRGKR